MDRFKKTEIITLYNNIIILFLMTTYIAPFCKDSIQDILSLIQDDCTEITLIGSEGEEKRIRKTKYEHGEMKTIDGAVEYDKMFIIKTLMKKLKIKLEMKHGVLECEFKKINDTMECLVIGHNTFDVDDMDCKDWCLKN